MWLKIALKKKWELWKQKESRVFKKGKMYINSDLMKTDRRIPGIIREKAKKRKEVMQHLDIKT